MKLLFIVYDYYIQEKTMKLSILQTILSNKIYFIFRKSHKMTE